MELSDRPMFMSIKWMILYSTLGGLFGVQLIVSITKKIVSLIKNFLTYAFPNSLISMDIYSL